MKDPQALVAQLSQDGKRLLRLLIEVAQDPANTGIGYQQALDRLGISTAGYRNAGDAMDKNGMDEVNAWSLQHALPAITGLITNQQTGWPGDGYFKCRGLASPNGTSQRAQKSMEWYVTERKNVTTYDWQPFLDALNTEELDAKTAEKTHRSCPAP